MNLSEIQKRDMLNSSTTVHKNDYSEETKPGRNFKVGAFEKKTGYTRLHVGIHVKEWDRVRVNR